MIYLASPYSHPDPAVMEARYEAAVSAVGYITKSANHHLYSPIVHYHRVTKIFNLPTSAEFWMEINHATIDLCESIYVLSIDGWDRSVGVIDEIAYAKSKGIPVWYLATDGIEFSALAMQPWK